MITENICIKTKWEFFFTKETISQLNDKETISQLNDKETISQLNDKETISKLNNKETISQLNDKETISQLSYYETFPRSIGFGHHLRIWIFKMKLKLYHDSISIPSVQVSFSYILFKSVLYCSPFLSI